MKHLIIIGARGFGREMFNSATESLGYGTEFDIKGFLDDKAEALDGFEGYPPIVSSVEAYEPHPDDVFVCALGDVKYKIKYVQMMLDKGGEFITLIHNTAYISKNVEIGIGCLILADSRIHCDVKVGNFVTIQPKATIGHDTIIEDWCMIGTLTCCGGVSYIEEGATMHLCSVLSPNKRLGSYSVLGACSFAARNVKSGTIVIGVPAKELITPKLDRK